MPRSLSQLPLKKSWFKSTRESLNVFWNRSQTKLWAIFQIVSGGILASLDQINKWVSDPTFKSYLDQFDLPKSLIIGIAAFGLITYIVHGHGDDA